MKLAEHRPPRFGGFFCAYCEMGYCRSHLLEIAALFESLDGQACDFFPILLIAQPKLNS